MSAYYVIGKNKRGISVRVDVKPREITDAGERFIRHTQQVDADYETPCRIWTASARFYVSDELTTTPRRFVMILAGLDLPIGVRLKAVCGTPNCVSFGHIGW